MEPVRRVSGRAIPLDRADVDTDQIIPAKHLKRIERTGYGPFAFERWRADAEFVLNRPEYAGAPILLAGANFGGGSSREHAVWALQQMGLGVVIAPSFADIFRNNSAKMGLLTVTLPQADVERLMARAQETPAAAITVDLETQMVSTPDGWSRRFEIDGFVKRTLLEGAGRDRPDAGAGRGDQRVRADSGGVPAGDERLSGGRRGMPGRASPTRLAAASGDGEENGLHLAEARGAASDDGGLRAAGSPEARSAVSSGGSARSAPTEWTLSRRVLPLGR